MSHILLLYLSLHEAADETGVAEIVMGSAPGTFHVAPDSIDALDWQAMTLLDRAVRREGPDIIEPTAAEQKKLEDYLMRVPMSDDWTLHDREEYLEHRILWMLRKLQRGVSVQELLESHAPWDRRSPPLDR